MITFINIFTFTQIMKKIIRGKDYLCNQLSKERINELSVGSGIVYQLKNPLKNKYFRDNFVVLSRKWNEFEEFVQEYDGISKSVSFSKYDMNGKLISSIGNIPFNEWNDHKSEMKSNPQQFANQYSNSIIDYKDKESNTKLSKSNLDKAPTFQKIYDLESIGIN